MSQFVAWKTVGQAEFDRIVEALLVRIGYNDPSCVVQAIDGRGGDGGVDIDVYRNGKLIHVYQLKYFPEGFSGEWGKSRKPQIANSFAAAMESSPPNWTLVVPTNPTVGERKTVTALSGGRKVRIRLMGSAQLDEQLAAFPDLLLNATRDNVVDALAAYNLEAAALAAPADLSNRLKKLSEIASGRSAYWEPDFEVRNGVVSETFRSKHPRAAELEPLGIQITTAFGPEHSILMKDYKKFLDYGSATAFELPSEVITSLRRLGPDWFAKEYEDGGSITFEPIDLPIEDQHAVEIRFLTDDGSIESSYVGTLARVSSGVIGLSATAVISGGIELTFRFKHDLSSDGGLDLTFDLTGLPVDDAMRAVRLRRDFQSTLHPELFIAGTKSMGMVILSGRLGGADDFEALIEDLYFLQGATKRMFSVPEQISAPDRLMIRVACLLFQGHCVILPGQGKIVGEIEPSLIQWVEQQAASSAPVTVEDPRFKLELLGAGLDFGTARIYPAAMALEKSTEFIAAMKSNSPLSGTFSLEPVNKGEPVRVYLPRFWNGPDGPRSPVPWGVAGIGEHPRFASTQGA